MATVLMVVFTGIIALATVWYVVVTTRLWKETRRSADAAKSSAEAAKLSAEAAKASADTDAALHRPYLGVSVLQRHTQYGAGMWAIRCRVKNYGTLPACAVSVHVDVDRRGQGQYGSGPLCNAWEMLPQAELEDFLQFRVDADAFTRLSNGEWPMIAHVEVKYNAPTGTRYTHIAEFAFDRTTQNFRPESSETKAADH